MNIKISTLRSVLHDSIEFNKRNKEFIDSIEKLIGSSLNISDISDYDCDLKLIFIESGGSEMLFKKQMDNLKEPFYFLTSGDNNSLAATLEILTYLNTIGLHGEIIHGSNQYIARRITELASKKEKLLENKKYGVIGVPSDWLISSIPGSNKLFNKFGAKLINIQLSELEDTYNNYDILDNFNDNGFTHKEVKSACKVSSILEKITEKYELSGLTIRCFDLLTSIKTTGCLGLAKLNEKGVIATCEGDIMAMISMAIIKEISGKSSFQANPSRIDVETSRVVFAHCTLPLDMTTSYNYMTHFESGIGLAIKGELKEEVVTVFRLSSDLKNYFVSKGKIIRNLNEPNLCRTQIEVELESDVNILLTKPCGNHHIIVYGDYVKEINNLLK